MKLDWLHKTLVAIIVGLGLLFWFTPYRYVEQIGPLKTIVRINRITGTTHWLGNTGWEIADDQTREQKEKDLAESRAYYAKKAEEAEKAEAARKEREPARVWEGISSGMPRVIEAIESRVEILSQMKKLPVGMTAERLAKAKTGLAEITKHWTEATAAATAGNLTDAFAKGTAAKKKAAEVLTALNMPVPEALK